MNIMDETDVKLLGKLLSDARLSYRRIADEIRISTPTVLTRIKMLKKESVIKFYSAILDHKKLGYDLTAIIEVTSVKGKVAEVTKFPNVCVYDMGGLTDMIVVAKFKNRSQLSNFVKKDLTLPYVERTNTHVVLLTVKEDFRLRSEEHTSE